MKNTSECKKSRAQKIMAENYTILPKKSVRTTSYPVAASSFPRCEAFMRSPRPPPRRAHPFLFTICGGGEIRTHVSLAAPKVFETWLISLSKHSSLASPMRIELIYRPPQGRALSVKLRGQ